MRDDREGAARLRPRRQPEQRRQRHPRACCPQLTEERRREYIKLAAHQGRGRQGLGPQHPPARQGRRSTSSSRTARSARTTAPRREGARRRRPRSTSTASTSCSSTRKPSCSRSESAVPIAQASPAPQARRPVTPRRAGRADLAAGPRPAGGHRGRRRPRRAMVIALAVHPQGGFSLRHRGAALAVGVWELRERPRRVARSAFSLVRSWVGAVSMIVAAYVGRGPEALHRSPSASTCVGSCSCWRRWPTGPDGRRATSPARLRRGRTRRFLAGFAVLMLARRTTAPGGSSSSSSVTVLSDIGGYAAGVLFGQAPDGAVGQPEEVVGGLRRLGGLSAPSPAPLAVVAAARRRRGGGGARRRCRGWRRDARRPDRVAASSATSASRTWARSCPATAASWTASTRCSSRAGRLPGVPGALARPASASRAGMP